MAQAETPAQRTARLRQEALAAFYANRANAVHERPGYTVAQGSPAAAPAKPQAPDGRSMLQRLLDALGGNPSGQ